MNGEPTTQQKKRGPGLMMTVPTHSPSMLLPDIRDYLAAFPAAKIKIEIRGGEFLMQSRGWVK